MGKAATVKLHIETLSTSWGSAFQDVFPFVEFPLKGVMMHGARRSSLKFKTVTESQMRLAAWKAGITLIDYFNPKYDWDIHKPLDEIFRECNTPVFLVRQWHTQVKHEMYTRIRPCHR